MSLLEEYHDEKICKIAGNTMHKYGNRMHKYGNTMHKYGNTMHMTDVFEGAHVLRVRLDIIAIAASF